MTGKLINTDSTKTELRVYQLVCQLSRKFMLSILMYAGKNSNFRRSSYTLQDDARNECLTLIGLDTASCNQRINLTQLCRNSRSRKDKTSGRKIDDCDVVAAPDSPSCKQTISDPPISDPQTSDPLISDPPMSNPVISDPPMSNPPISIPSKAK